MPDQKLHEEKTKIITVVTTDIRNFTYHSRPYEGEEKEEFLQRFAVLCDIVRDFHNLTNDCARRYDTKKEAIVLTTGDGLIIGFQDLKHAATAFKTIRDLQHEYVSFFKKSNKQIAEKRQSTALGYGIGIHTGHVMIRHYDSYHIPGKVDTIILGDALNISTRLEKLTKEHSGCGVMISQDAYQAICQQLGKESIQDCFDYQIHQITGYYPLRVYGLPMPPCI